MAIRRGCGKGYKGTLEERFWLKVNKNHPDYPGCWIFGKNRLGVHQTIRVNNDVGIHYSHRVSYWIHNPEWDLEDSLRVLHKCDVPSCVRPDHLFLGTQADNIKDMDLKGRRITLKGEDHGRSTLTVKMVKEMRKLYATRIENAEITKKFIAQQFGITPSAAGKVLRRILWVHVKDEDD